MLFRITSHRQYELSRSIAQQQLAKSAKLQLDITSGVRVRRPSDDPDAMKIILNQQSLISRYTKQLDSLSQVRSDLNQVTSETQNAQQLIVQAKSLAIQARQATEDTDRAAYAQQLDSILQRLEQIANTSSGGRFLFSGSQTGTKPYSGIVDGQPTYSGGDQAGTVALAGLPAFAVYQPGRDVFQAPSSGEIVVTGNTGIQPGSGTSSGNAATTITVRHTLTTFGTGSGIQAGANSAAGDTLIGAHTLTINDTSGTGASGTISLNGGPEVAFTSADGDLLVNGPNGETIHLDTTAITTGFNGTVSVDSAGTISIDGGLTEVPINFSANQTLVNDELGLVENFDTRNITQVGTGNVEFTSSGDIFRVIKSLRDDIVNTRQLSPTEWGDALDRRLGELDAANNHLLSVVGEQSVAAQGLDDLESRLQDAKTAANSKLSETQGTDYTSAIVQLQEQQNSLQYTLKSLATLSNISILDFLS